MALWSDLLLFLITVYTWYFLPEKRYWLKDVCYAKRGDFVWNDRLSSDFLRKEDLLKPRRNNFCAFYANFQKKCLILVSAPRHKQTISHLLDKPTKGRRQRLRPALTLIIRLRSLRRSTCEDPYPTWQPDARHTLVLGVKIKRGWYVFWALRSVFSHMNGMLSPRPFE